MDSIPDVVFCCFLKQKLYSHCSSLPSCINGDLVLTRNINGYLVMIGEANVKLLSMYSNGYGTLGVHTITLGMV